MKNKKSKDEILQKIAEIPKEDFDGHTDFQKLTPRQKLQWLSSTAYFAYIVSKNNSKLGCANFFK